MTQSSHINKRRKAYWFGILAEYVAIAYLLLTGHRVLFLRYKSYVGEIDIVARRGNYLLLIEVKARKYVSNPHGLVSRTQQKRILRAGDALLSRYAHLRSLQPRCDLICIHRKGFRHYRNAWN